MIGKPFLAALGAKPRFKVPVVIGQNYWPDWERYELAARDIFARRFYTSQRFAGPLVVEFQNRIENFLGVKHAIAIRNATTGLMIATYTFGLNGKVIVPSWTHISTIEALLWAKCKPIFCDIDPTSQQLSLTSLRSRLEKRDIEAILGVHLWGSALPVAELEELAKEYGVIIYYDAAHAFGCRVGERGIGSFGRAEVFSFHAANIVSTGEGGCITTNDDTLAAKFISMRGDEIAATGAALQSATSRMSEMQAAVGMMMLDDFEHNRRRNEDLHLRYQACLSGVGGIRILEPQNVTLSNFQSLTVVIDSSRFGLSRDQLLEVLREENVLASDPFNLPAHSLRTFASDTNDREQLKNTNAAALDTLQLPLGAHVSSKHVEVICEIIRHAQACAESVKLRPAHATPI
jgi:dTDP-4-amino-4,6-dideoxygalactose transaminase